MTGELVLLTGGTGFLGYTILIDLLKHGYRVRIPARSHAKIARVRAAPSIAALDPPETHLMFVLVPDMAAPGAYDEAVQDVELIIHAAAPLPADHAGEAGHREDAKLEDAFVTACVQGNLGILKSAHEKGKRVRRIVMTSSTVAIAPAEFYSDAAAAAQREAGEEIVRGSDTRILIPMPPYKSQLHAYCAAKTASLKAAEDFIRDYSPLFDMISIMPSLVFGKDELATGTSSTGIMMSRLLPGTDANDSNNNNIRQGEITAVGNSVLCTDVARAHVRALDADIEGNQSFVLNTDAKWEDTVPIAKSQFPREFESGLFRPGGPQWTTVPLKWDTSKVQDVLGIKLATYDVMIKEVVGEYIEKTGSE
ncbi:NAD(P)-binding protein [Apiospora arundinis]|uniref:NAD(P)-binding protein n=1 Tax=Apiospora arundinis TaxID=335852 RepID=A0ABR2JIN1_9PEZI